MKKQFRYKGLSVFMILALSLTSCLDNGYDTIIIEDKDYGSKHGIPSDFDAEPNPTVNFTNTNIPNIQHSVENETGDIIIRFDMTGVQDPNTYDWLTLNGTGEPAQNVWVSIDGKPKGITVYNSNENEEQQVVLNDVVFLVDNSGSMGEEADAIARDIISWAKTLSATVNVQFGCVGYDGYITGAIDITDVNSLSSYLNHASGIYRTEGFSGPNKDYLNSQSYYYDLESQEECGVAALRFADENFNFRSGSNRIYINFTDEENQPQGLSKWSVNYVNNQNNWSAARGTIHTVFSGSTPVYESALYFEKPWLLSTYTGGTIMYTNSSFSGVSLDMIPVTQAIQNSYIIRFTNVEEFMDGKPHIVKITIISEDGSVQAEKVFNVVFGN